MKKLSKIVAVVLTFVAFAISCAAGKSYLCCPQSDTAIIVPLGGNAWKVGKDSVGGELTNDGIVKWTDKQVKFTAYVRFANKGNFKLWVNAKVAGGKSRISISVLNSVKEIEITGATFRDVYAGEWHITDTGYTAFEIKGLNKTGIEFAAVNSIKLSGAAITSRTAFVKNNEGEFYYWGRRGPSVHLNYTTPAGINAEWFYNEVTVTKGNDVLGSYFMADGFAEGYFGMQVNSPTERHILFSVWSPYKTDNPGQIPDGQKIIMLKKGEGVHTGEFGNEGSGGQSYLLYNWQAGNTYKFFNARQTRWQQPHPFIPLIFLRLK